MAWWGVRMVAAAGADTRPNVFILLTELGPMKDAGIVRPPQS